MSSFFQVFGTYFVSFFFWGVSAGAPGSEVELVLENEEGDVHSVILTRQARIHKEVSPAKKKNMNIYKRKSNLKKRQQLKGQVNEYWVALASRIDKIIGLFCKRAL